MWTLFIYFVGFVKNLHVIIYSFFLRSYCFLRELVIFYYYITTCKRLKDPTLICNTYYFVGGSKLKKANKRRKMSAYLGVPSLNISPSRVNEKLGHVHPILQSQNVQTSTAVRILGVHISSMLQQNSNNLLMTLKCCQPAIINVVLSSFESWLDEDYFKIIIKGHFLPKHRPKSTGWVTL